MNDFVEVLIQVLAGFFGFAVLAAVVKCWSSYKKEKTKSALVKAILVTLFFIVVLLAEVLYVINSREPPQGGETGSPSSTITATAITTQHISPASSEDSCTETGFPFVGKGTYIGELDEKHQCNGFGYMYYESGDQYNGSWTHNKKDGCGTYWYQKSNDIYMGEWKDDERTGTGLFIWNADKGLASEFLEKPDTAISQAVLEEINNNYKYSFYYGKLSAGQLKEGTYYNWFGELNTVSDDGKMEIRAVYGKYTGNFSNDQFEGTGEFYYSNGDTFTGTFRDGNTWNGKYRHRIIKNGKEEFVEYKVQDGKIIK